ncbi:related to Acetamidase regulatory protein [Cephalotrichum gorgonifer]|uniref:Related to Acetamidase regulatory protein n=1 Tax=Cephalotrichum gorgonifer TaxID=2041049 RepID=A0AAE8N2W7_9PEZI|nr:related to Acetamidase regulatory protein [Cephalotrichum gorgonifer]
MQRITRAQAATRAACTACHQRKVKCDAHDVGIPCSSCRLASRDDCRIHQKRKRASKSAARSLVSASPRLLARSSVTNGEPTSPRNTVNVVASPQSPIAASPADDRQSLRWTPASAGLAGVDIHAAEDGEYLYKRHLVEFIDQPELVERPIDSKARMTYIGTDVSNVNFLVRNQFGARLPASDVCHYPTNRIAQRSLADGLPLDAFQLPPKDTVDQLLNAYFRHVNPGFPVVDERIFVTQYRARDPENRPSLLLLNAILVVGAHVLYSRDQEKRDSCKAAFFRRAKTLFDAGFERNRDTTVQAALLLTWHTDGPEDVTANVWFWLGVAVRTAMGLGMHRDADGSTLVPHNKRMWRRVWWLLFQSDVWASLQYGRPQSIHLEDSNVQKLGVSDFVDCGDDVRPEYMIQMSQLAVIISEALRARARAVNAEARAADLRQTDEKLASWALRLLPQLHLTTASGSDIWSANLHVHYNTALILLHRSPPHPGPKDAVAGQRQHDENSEICVAAASAVQSLFQSLCQSDNLRCLWMSTINCLFTALIQLSTEIRLSNPLLAISALRRYDSALVSLKRLAEYWPNAQSILHFFEKSARINSAREPDAGRPRQAGVEARLGPGTTMTQDSRVSVPLGTVGAVRPGPSLGDLPPSQFNAGTQMEMTGPAMPFEDTHPLQQQSMSSLLQPACKRSDDGVSGDYNDVDDAEEMPDTWKEWQSQNWNAPEFPDVFLFTF